MMKSCAVSLYPLTSDFIIFFPSSANVLLKRRLFISVAKVDLSHSILSVLRTRWMLQWNSYSPWRQSINRSQVRTTSRERPKRPRLRKPPPRSREAPPLLLPASMRGLLSRERWSGNWRLKRPQRWDHKYRYCQSFLLWVLILLWSPAAVPAAATEWVSSCWLFIRIKLTLQWSSCWHWRRSINSRLDRIINQDKRQAALPRPRPSLPQPSPALHLRPRNCSQRWPNRESWWGSWSPRRPPR